MAKIQLGNMAQSVSGSIGGTTFGRNKGGAYARQKSSPVQPRTERQLEVRANLSLVAQAWRNLTAAIRAEWETWAQAHPVVDVFGQALKLSGMSAFCKISADCLNIGLEIPAAPPPDPTEEVPAPISAVATADDQTVTVTFDGNPAASDVIALWATPGISAGRSYVNSQLRFAGMLVGAGSAPTVNLVLNSVNPLLNFTTGQKIGLLVVRYSEDGVVMASNSLTVIATAGT